LFTNIRKPQPGWKCIGSWFWRLGSPRWRGQHLVRTFLLHSTRQEEKGGRVKKRKEGGREREKQSKREGRRVKLILS
jgi:hypothetical protein